MTQILQFLTAAPIIFAAVIGLIMVMTHLETTLVGPPGRPPDEGALPHPAADLPPLPLEGPLGLERPTVIRFVLPFGRHLRRRARSSGQRVSSGPPAR